MEMKVPSIPICTDDFEFMSLPIINSSSVVVVHDMLQQDEFEFGDPSADNFNPLCLQAFQHGSPIEFSAISQVDFPNAFAFASFAKFSLRYICFLASSCVSRRGHVSQIRLCENDGIRNNILRCCKNVN